MISAMPAVCQCRHDDATVNAGLPQSGLPSCSLSRREREQKDCSSLTVLALIILVLLFGLGQDALAAYDWTAGTVITAFVAALMLLTRRL